VVHCSNPSTSSSPCSGAGLGLSPYMPFQQHSGAAAKTYLGTGTGYKMAQCKEASGGPVGSSMRGYGWVAAVRGGMRSTWARASPGQTPSSAGQWSGWGRQGAWGDHVSLSPSMLDQSPSKGHSAEILCCCLPKKESNCMPGSLVPTSPSLPPSRFLALLLLQQYYSWSPGWLPAQVITRCPLVFEQDICSP